MHPNESVLNDYIDGVLSPATAQEVEQHVASCTQCSAQVATLSSMTAALADLPRSIAPDRDLRAGIWRRIADEKKGPLTARRDTSLWSSRYHLAAAAVMLIALSSVITLLLTREPDGTQPTASNGAGTLVHVQRVEREYAQSVAELELLLRKNRAALSSETVRILERNMRVIDDAIEEARTALARDPNSNVLSELLRSAYQRKVELMQQAAKSSAAT